MFEKAQKISRIALIAFAMLLVSAISSASESEEILHPQSLDYTGINALKEADPNLTGSGVKFAVISRSITYTDGQPQNDYQPNSRHNCFAEKQFSFYDQNDLPTAISPHSTAICSILFGNDPNASNPELGKFHYQGVVPAATADIYEFWHFLTDNIFPHTPPDADVITASIGNHFEDWWTRGIEAIAEHHGLIIVAGIGNGENAYDPALYPAAGANVIGVGVIDSAKAKEIGIDLRQFGLAHPEHSSFGPTVNGRAKPDIVAPGNCLAADANDANGYEPTGSWASFSTPIVAGTVGLLVQKAKLDTDLSQAVSPQGGNCVIKAILLNSATKLPYWHKGKLPKEDDHETPLDYIQGAGMLNALNAYKHLTAGLQKPDSNAAGSTIGWDNNQLTKNSENVYKITLADSADKFITATITWNRHYDSNYPFESIPAKDADLRLELWAVDVNEPNNDYLLDYSDSQIDNVEHLYSQTDANYTDYEIVVSYAELDDPNRIPPTQRYGLAWNVTEKPDSNNILAYDLNIDGIVDQSDFVVFIDSLLREHQLPESYILGDINSDGVLDVNDIEILWKQMGRKADWVGVTAGEPVNEN